MSTIIELQKKISKIILRKLAMMSKEKIDDAIYLKGYFFGELNMLENIILRLADLDLIGEKLYSFIRTIRKIEDKKRGENK